MTNTNLEEHYGSRVIEARIIRDRLYLYLVHGVQLIVYDDGQSCCEHRYMTCDDDLSKLVGGLLVEISERDGPDAEAEYSEHEQKFVVVQTDIGGITLCTHNEHNGYYGGFSINVKANKVWQWETEKEDKDES